MASLQKKIVKGKEYWSIVESKRINGKPRPVVIEYIGNTKKLFEKLQNNNIKNNSIKSYSHGDTHSLMAIAKKIGIQEILDDTFKNQIRDGLSRSTSLILAAIHRTCKPGSKKEFEEWFKTTTLHHELDIKPETTTSQHFWKQMDGITEKELMLAEDAITKKILQMYDIGLDKLALDYTNYFTYISTDNKKNELAQRGRNKQKRYDLRQCSLTVVTSKEAGIPLFSHVYEGNKNDQTEFSEYLPLFEKRFPDCDLKEITLIFDGGSNTKKNLAALKTHYICSFSLAYCKELYDIDISDYNETNINDRLVKFYRTAKNIWSKKRTCILTFSQKLFDGQIRELDENIVKVINNLKELNDKLSNEKSSIDKSEKGIKSRVEKILKYKYIPDIIWTEVKDNKVIYNIDIIQKQEIVNRYFGKKLTITDRDEWTTEEILEAYYEQDCIEKIFRDTKNVEHFSLRPIYHWTDQKIRVHVFICLLGLTLSSILQKELYNKGIDISKNRLMETLSQIRQCWVKDSVGNKVTKILEDMDDLQSDIWSVVKAI